MKTFTSVQANLLENHPILGVPVAKGNSYKQRKEALDLFDFEENPSRFKKIPLNDRLIIKDFLKTAKTEHELIQMIDSRFPPHTYSAVSVKTGEIYQTIRYTKYADYAVEEFRRINGL